MKLMEELILGYTKQQSILYESYIEYLLVVLRDKGCIKSESLIISNFKHVFTSKQLDIEILNKSLWREIEDLTF